MTRKKIVNLDDYRILKKARLVRDSAIGSLSSRPLCDDPLWECLERNLKIPEHLFSREKKD